MVTVLGIIGAGLAGCGTSQADKLAEQLRKAGYTDVSAQADYDTTYNKKKKKNVKKLDDYEATAKAGNCLVDVEQDVDSTDYVVETANGKDMNLRNLSARELIVELEKQGIRC
jgi:tRNA uridine 5-carbamoylmethylation protein Kti12